MRTPAALQAETTVPHPAVASGRPETASERTLTRWWPALLFVAVVVVVDQASKWAAGHGQVGVDYTVNSGVSRDAPRLFDAVVRNVGVGGALDLAGVVLLAVLLAVTVRHARGLVRVGLLLYTAGSAGNVADRLGTSYVTAPAPHPRGVVDLLALGNANVADQAIHAGMALLAVAAVLHAAGGPGRVLHLAHVTARRARSAWRPTVAVIVAAAGGLWVGAAGQAGALRSARADAANATAFASLSGVQLPGCHRPGGTPGSVTAPVHRATYLCPVTTTGGRRVVLRVTRTFPRPAPTIAITDPGDSK